MANNPVHADRVRETTTSTGTGTINLDGAVTGFQTFVSGVGDGEECSYAIIAVDGDGVPTGDWELGFGTVTDASPDTLSRTPYASSNAGSAVNFGAGTKQVFATPGSRVFPEVGCSLYRTSVQSIPNSTETAISWDGETYDPFGMHEGVTNPSRMTVAVPGRYLVVVVAKFATNASGDRSLRLFKNGAIVTYVTDRANSAGSSYKSFTYVLELAASDYIEIYAHQTSGTALDLGGTSALESSVILQRLTT